MCGGRRAGGVIYDGPGLTLTTGLNSGGEAVYTGSAELPIQDRWPEKINKSGPWEN